MNHQKLPPHGLYLPCSFLRARDGDTVVVRLLDGGMKWAIRLLDVDCPEMRGKTADAGLAAKQFVESVLGDSDHLSVFVPAPPQGSDGNLLKWLTFDRIPGDIWIGTETRLTELLVEHGHAKRVEPRAKG